MILNLTLIALHVIKRNLNLVISVIKMSPYSYASSKISFCSVTSFDEDTSYKLDVQKRAFGSKRNHLQRRRGPAARPWPASSRHCRRSLHSLSLCCPWCCRRGRCQSAAMCGPVVAHVNHLITAHWLMHRGLDQTIQFLHFHERHPSASPISRDPSIFLILGDDRH